MGSVPQVTNSFAQFIDDIISGAVEGIGATALELLAETEEPILALPIIKQVFEYFVNKYLADFAIGAENGITQIIMNVQTTNELNTFSTALATLLKAKQGGNPDAITQATTDLNNAFKGIVHWDGTATSH